MHIFPKLRNVCSYLAGRSSCAEGHPAVGLPSISWDKLICETRCEGERQLLFCKSEILSIPGSTVLGLKIRNSDIKVTLWNFSSRSISCDCLVWKKGKSHRWKSCIKMSLQNGRRENCAKYIGTACLVPVYGQKVVSVHYFPVQCTGTTFCPYTDWISAFPSSSLLRAHLYATPSSMVNKCRYWWITHGYLVLGTILIIIWGSQCADAPWCSHFSTNICCVIQEGVKSIEKCMHRGASARLERHTLSLGQNKHG